MIKIYEKSYSELINLKTFSERFEYLKLSGSVGYETFGSKRYLNQILYHSEEWSSIRDKIIIRDLGRDLGVEGYEIYGDIFVHHINPIAPNDILNFSKKVYDENNLITTSRVTHNAIHYGDERNLMTVTKRRKNDTVLWKKGGT